MDKTDLKKIFSDHKVDIPDDGFSERVIGRLPERMTMLPQIVMTTFVVVGLTLTFAIQGFVPVIEQIESLITSVSQLQIPPPSAIITYISLLALTGMIGFSVAQAEV